MPRMTDIHPARRQEFAEVPVAKVMASRMAIPIALINLAKSRVHEFYVWGWAEYDDIFTHTPRHRTEYCMRLVPITETADQTKMELQNYKYHNGMDDECPAERWRTKKGGEWIEPRKPRIVLGVPQFSSVVVMPAQSRPRPHGAHLYTTRP